MPEIVHVFVFDTLADWEPGYAVAGLNNPDGQKTPGRFEVRTVATRRESVTTAGGLRIQPDLTLDEVGPDASAMLILPGGDAWDHGRNQDAVEKAKAMLAAGVPVAAICGATAGLARGGLLDARKHTSNAPDYLAATGYGGAHLYQSADAVSDGNVITAPGTKPLEFAREIFARLDVYEDRVLEAWYGLFKTGDPKYFAALTAGPPAA